MSTKCLICYSDIDSLQLSNKCIGASGGVKVEAEKSLLSKHLNVIFILRDIFDVPVFQLSSYLKNCPKVEDWICICDKCQDIVKGYRRIYDDILEISRKFEEAKSGIIQIVKKSYNDDRQGQNMVVPLDITDECRRFINSYEYQNPHNPFKDGDLKALELVKSTHQGSWHWTRNLGDTFGTVPDSPADVQINDQDHWSGGEHEDDGDELMEPEPEEQVENVKLTRRGRGRPPKSQKRLKELVDDWKPGYKPKTSKLTPKKPKLKSKTRKTPPAPIQRPIKYHCPHSPECSLHFSSKLTLESHLKEDHGLVKQQGSRKKYPLECYHESDTRKRRFQIRIRSKCEPCNKWFTCQGSLQSHMKLIHENKFPYYCKTCGVGRHSKSILEKHEALCSTKPEEVPILPETESCPEEGCTMIVSRITGLEVHFREKHPEREPFSGCPHCEQKLYTKMGYTRHLKREHQITKPFKCEHCGQEFEKQFSLNNHKKSALRCKLLYQSETEATIICDICGGTFGSQANLQRHIDSQHEDKFKMRCAHCGKRFDKEEIVNVHLFKRHQIGDGSNLKYKCKVEGCSRIFYAPKALECHMAIHEGRTPQFTCEECGKGFHGRWGLTQHKKLMHVNKLNSEKFKCVVCGAEFGIIEYLKRHKRTVHKIFPEKRRQDL